MAGGGRLSVLSPPVAARLQRLLVGDFAHAVPACLRFPRTCPGLETTQDRFNLFRRRLRRLSLHGESPPCPENKARGGDQDGGRGEFAPERTTLELSLRAGAISGRSAGKPINRYCANRRRYR